MTRTVTTKRWKFAAGLAAVALIAGACGADDDDADDGDDVATDDSTADDDSSDDDSSDDDSTDDTVEVTQDEALAAYVEREHFECDRLPHTILSAIKRHRRVGQGGADPIIYRLHD